MSFLLCCSSFDPVFMIRVTALLLHIKLVAVNPVNISTMQRLVLFCFLASCAVSATTLIVGNYSLKTSKGDTCLLAHMALKIRLESAEANGTFVVQPQAATVEGSCGNTNANLSIVFAQGCITFLFNKSVANNTVYVNALSFNLTYAFKKGESKRYSVSNATNLFPAKIGHSYSCKNESIHMGNGLYLDVSQDRMQAFNLTNNDFGRSDPCPADQPDYRVAIAVGVTLLVLIVLVLVVYLLGRRKRTDGYQSL
ncbi:unnamed protein product [Menidia menidia]|uniref:(Atlantic silverside) hypothetical protein n=1 Tax=Menidia menidia TaxID=238744 RepID=A0A8S4B532_9TELE|nr:unnamed protein product [Menidia menidia]